MADVLVPRDILERAANFVEEADDVDESSESRAVLTALDDALSEPYLSGYLLPQDALWQADLAVAKLMMLLDAIREGIVTLHGSPEFLEALQPHLVTAHEAADTYTTYRLADTIEAVYHR